MAFEMVSDIFVNMAVSVVGARRKMLFNSKMRVEMYEALSLLMENGVKLDDSLRGMYDIFSDKGKKRKDMRAIVSIDCLNGIGSGKPLSIVLSKWTNYQETSLISAGEKAGDLKSAFDEAINAITVKKQMMSAIIPPMIYLTMLAVIIGFLLALVSGSIVPKMAKSTDPSSWTGAAAALYMLSQFVVHYGFVAVLSVVTSILLITTTFGSFRGPLRPYFDRIPPWSIYRTLQGSTFLLNVSVMLKSGVKLQVALRMLQTQANPWLRERLLAAQYGIGIGGNLGEALYRAGYNFPDKRAIQYLMILANLDGFETAMSRFGDRWLNESLKKIQFSAKVMLGCGLVVIGLLLLLILGGMSGMEDAVTSNVGR